MTEIDKTGGYVMTLIRFEEKGNIKFNITDLKRMFYFVRIRPREYRIVAAIECLKAF